MIVMSLILRLVFQTWHASFPPPDPLRAAAGQ